MAIDPTLTRLLDAYREAVENEAYHRVAQAEMFVAGRKARDEWRTQLERLLPRTASARRAVEDYVNRRET